MSCGGLCVVVVIYTTRSSVCPDDGFPAATTVNRLGSPVQSPNDAQRQTVQTARNVGTTRVSDRQSPVALRCCSRMDKNDQRLSRLLENQTAIRLGQVFWAETRFNPIQRPFWAACSISPRHVLSLIRTWGLIDHRMKASWTWFVW